MPSLRVDLNGQCLTEVNVAGLDMLTVDVSGARVDAELAKLTVTGGTYPKDSAPTFLIWLDDSVALEEGDRLEVSFNESGHTSRAGKTIDELYPDEPEAPEEANVLDLLPQVIEELRAKPYVREGYRFAMESPRSERYSDTTPAREKLSGRTSAVS